MAEQAIVRAELIELKEDFSDVQPNGQRVPVQFNPETLKLSYSNQVQSQNNGGSGGGSHGAGNQSQGTPARQFVGAGTTKLTVQLTFDVTASGERFLNSEGRQQDGNQFMVDDVRRVTARVLYFIKPKDAGAGARDASQRVPPGLRFLWGKFLFDGIVESLEENVEFFSADGKALRASVTLNMVQQSILVPAFTGDGRVTRPAAAQGTTPLAVARGGQSLQQISDNNPGAGSGARQAGASPAAGAGAAFGSGGWQRIAAANGIENPRALDPGQFIDLSANRPRIVTG